MGGSIKKAREAAGNVGEIDVNVGKENRVKIEVQLLATTSPTFSRIRKLKENY